MDALARACALAALLTLGGCASYDAHRGLSYDSADPAALFDWYEPTGGLFGKPEGLRPTILAIHGGAWRTGDRSWGEDVAKEFCCDGYAVIAVDYRLAPAHRWPAQIEDCQRALAWLLANPDAVNIDPSRIASFGVSAGGHLAAMLALRGPGPRVRAAVDSDGEGDLTVYGAEPIMADEDSILSDVLGAPPPFAPSALADLSPARFARPDAAVLLIHSRGDPNIYYSQSTRLHAALVAAGATTEMVTLDGDCHSKCWQDSLSEIRAFLARTLR